MNKLAILATVALAGLAAGVGAIILRSQSAGNASSGSSLVYVAVGDYSFSPTRVTIKAGTTVQWMNIDSVAHTVTFGSHDDMGGSMGSDMLGHMGAYQYRFMEPGTYEYHCEPHPYMTGTVVVNPQEAAR